MQCRDTLGDEALPGFRGIAAAKGKHHAALRCLASSNPQLHKAVPTDGVNHGSLTHPVAAHEDRAAGTVDSDELPLIVEWEDRAAVIEFYQQDIKRPHPAKLVRAGDARQSQHRRERPIDDHLLADSRQLNPPPRQYGGARISDRGATTRRLHADARYRAGGGINVPRSGGTDDYPGAGRQGAAEVEENDPGLALHETPAASMPSSLPALHECPQHLVDPRRRYASPSLVAVAQQARELADARLAPSSAAIRRGVVEVATPVRSWMRSVETTQAYGATPGASSNTVRCRSCCGAAASRVEERLLFRLAQRGKAIQRCERARHEMCAA